MPTIHSIDQVIEELQQIIELCEQNNDPLGYFAALYQEVTKQVKVGIANNFFDDGLRMEQLDIRFAERYLHAFRAYQRQQPITASWRAAFEAGSDPWLIVMQHLLLGMNAHINLDLGIAAAEVMEGKPIEGLRDDFHRINDILNSLVEQAQVQLSQVWPFLTWILRRTGRFDDRLVAFSMKLARDGAWKFAQTLAADPANTESLIQQRDQRIAEVAQLIVEPGPLAKIVFLFIRLGERRLPGKSPNEQAE